MMPPSTLTALADAQAVLLDMLAPCAPRIVAFAEATGLIASESLRVSAPTPPRAMAVRAGYAARADELVGASSFSPAFLNVAPVHVSPGDPLPDGCDCVLDAAAIDLSGPFAQALAESYPGENIRRAGEDFAAGAFIIRQGHRIIARDALLAARAGFSTLSVRQARVAILGEGDELGAYVAHLARASGAAVCEPGSAELVIALGSAPPDAELLVHALALEPGRDCAVGRSGAKPIIMLPRQPSQLVAGCFALVTPALDRLTTRAERLMLSLPLAAKISSRVGVTELALLQAKGGRFHPLAVGDAPLRALGAATHAVLVAAGSEGHAAGENCAAEAIEC